MARFRLRFLLQELDLTGPEVILGRGGECTISLDDPLVSRRHALIALTTKTAAISDLGSRNGVRVNGTLITGPTALTPGDRVRLGTQELVFVAAEDGSGRGSRSTGSLHSCATCGLLFPVESGTCPHCGHVLEPQLEDTVTGMIPVPEGAWTLHLLGEVIERALVRGRARDAERLLRRALSEVDQRAATGLQVDRQALDSLAIFAIRLACLSGEAEWLCWVLTNQHAEPTLLSNGVLEQLETVEWARFSSVVPIAVATLASWQTMPAFKLNSERQSAERFRALLERLSRSQD